MGTSAYDFKEKPAAFSSFFLGRMAEGEDGTNPIIDAEEKKWEYISDLPKIGLKPYDRAAWRDATLVRDEEDNVYGFGILPAAQTTSEFQGQDYWRGIMAPNQARSFISAQRITADREEYKEGSLGFLTDNTKEVVEPYLRTKSNWLKGFNLDNIGKGDFSDFGRYVDPGSRLGWGMQIQPEDLFDVEQPGYTQEIMIELIKEVQPEKYAWVSGLVGGEEEFLKLTREATNADTFFFLVNEAIDQVGLQTSLQHHMNQMEGMEEFWNLKAWPFFRDGLINDPDMPASVMIGLVTAGIGTGIGVAGSVVWGGGKVIKKIPLLKRLKAMQKTGDFVADIGKTQIVGKGTKLTKIVDYLPENIGMTTLRHISPGTAKSIAARKGITGYLFRTPVHAFEGFLEGGIAEGLNQSAKIRTGNIEEYNWKAILDEAILESGFSVIANPILGNIINSMVWGPKVITGKVVGEFIETLPLGSQMRASIKHAWSDANTRTDNPILEAMAHYDLGDSIVDDLNATLKGEGISMDDLLGGHLSHLMDPLLMNPDSNQYDDVVGFAQLIKNIKEDLDGRKLTHDEFVDMFAAGIAAELGINDTKAVMNLASLAKTRLRVAKQVKKKNRFRRILGQELFTIDTYLDSTEMTDNEIWDIFVDEDLTAVVKAEMKKEGKDFDSADATSRLETLRTIQDNAINKLNGARIKIVTETAEIQNQATQVEDDVAGLARKIKKNSVWSRLSSGLMDWLNKRTHSPDSVISPPDQNVTMEHLDNIADSLLRGEELTKEQTEVYIKNKDYINKKVKLLKKRGELQERLEKAEEKREDAKKKLEGLKVYVNDVQSGKKRGRGKETPENVAELKAQGISDAETALLRAEKAIEEIKAEIKELDETGITVTPEGGPSDPIGSNQETQKRLKELWQALREAKKNIKDEELVRQIEAKLKEIDGLIKRGKAAVEEYSKFESNDPEIKKLQDTQKDLLKQVEDLRKGLDSVLDEDDKKLRDIVIELQKGMHRWVEILGKKDKGDKEFLNKDDFTEEEWKAITEGYALWGKQTKKFIKHLHPEKIKQITASKKKLGKGIKQGRVSNSDLIHMLVLLTNKSKTTTTTKFKKHPAYNQIGDIEKQYKKIEGELSKKRRQKIKDDMDASGIDSFQLRTFEQIIYFQNSEKAKLKRRRVVLEKTIDNKNGEITSESLALFLPTSKVKEDLPKDKTYTKEEALEIYDEASEERRAGIRSLSPGHYRYRDWSEKPGAPSTAAGWNINNINTVPKLDRTNSESMEETERLKNKIEAKEELEDVVFGRVEELMALTEFQTQLIGLYSGPWRNVMDGIVPIFVVDSALPAGIYDTSLIHLARKAMRTEDGEVIPDSVSNEMLEADYDMLMVDLNELISIVTQRIARSNDDMKEIAYAELEDLIKIIRDKGNRKSRNGVFASLNFVQRMLQASQTVNTDLARTHGLLVDLDSQTLAPDLTYTIKVDWDPINKEWSADSIEAAKEEYFGFMREGMKSRIADQPRLKKKIRKFLGLTDRANDGDIADAILKLLNESTEYDLDMSDIFKMADGTTGWQPAKGLGGQLVDFFLTYEMEAKDLRPNQILTSSGRTEANSEDDTGAKIKGSSVRTAPFRIGESNLIAPQHIETTALVIEDTIMRARIRFALNVEITPEIRAEYKKWREERITTGDMPRPLARILDPEVRLLPTVTTGVGLDQTLLTRQELTDVLTEMLLDMPNIAYAFIHDSRFANYRLAYKTNLGVKLVHPDLSTGEPTLVPLSNIPSVLSIGDMNPHLEPLGIQVVEQITAMEEGFAIEHAEKFGPEYWTNDLFWDEILSPQTYMDKKVNGMYITKILSLTSEDAKRALKELREGMNMTIENPDYYIKAGLRLATTIRTDMQNLEGYDVLKPFVKFYDSLNENNISTELEYEAYIENNPDTDLAKQMEAMRELWKLPVMTGALYGGGFKSWTEQWQEGGKGYKDVLNDLKASGIGLSIGDNYKGIPKSLAMLGKSIYKNSGQENARVVEVALGIPGLKEKAMAILAIRETVNDEYVANWEAMADAYDTELSKDNPVYQRNYIRRQLELNYARLAKREGITKEAFKKRYENSQMAEAHAKLDEIDKRVANGGEEMTPDEHETIMSLLMANNKVSWKQHQFLQSLNAQNATGYKIAVEILEAQAAAVGMRFDSEDLLGFEKHILYMAFFPGIESYRTYAARSTMNRHHHNTMFARIGNNREDFKSFMESITKEEWKDPILLSNKIRKWAEKPYRVADDGTIIYVEIEGESPLGQWDAIDNPHQLVNGKVVDPDTMTDEEFNQWHDDMVQTIEDLQIRNELLMLAVDDKPPLKAYTDENNMEEFRENAMKTWYEHSDEAAVDHLNRIRVEQNNTRDVEGNTIEGEAKFNEKGSGLVTPHAGHTITPRGVKEHRVQDLRHGQEDPATIATDKPRGFLSWVPQTRVIPYHNAGNFYLQSLVYQKQADAIMDPFDAVKEEIGKPLEDPNHLIPIEARGHVKPWDKGSLPGASPVHNVDVMDYLLGMEENPVAMMASVMTMELAEWSHANGFAEELKNPDLVPYIYLSMKLDKKINENIDYVLGSINFPDKDMSLEDQVLSARNKYLKFFHELFQLPRDIRHKEMHSLLLETKGHEIGILNPDMANLTLSEILVSVYQETNPLGRLSTKTLAHDAIKLGTIPLEHFVIKEGLNVDFEKIDKRATAIWPLIVQSHDFQQYLIEILWDHSIFQAIQDYSTKEGKEYLKAIKYAKSKNAWNMIHPEDRVAIIEHAGKLKEGAYDPVVNMDFMVEPVKNRPDMVKLVAINKKLIDGKADEGPMIFRNSVGKAFSFLMRVPRNVVGTTMKIGITPEGARLMLLSNVNAPLMERIYRSYHTNKQSGATTVDGKVVVVESEAEELQDYYAYSMHEQIEKARRESEALELIIQRISDEAKPKMLVDGSRTIGGTNPSVIDWLAYMAPSLKTGESRIPFYIRAHISPILQGLTNLERIGIDNVSTSLTPASTVNEFAPDIKTKTIQAIVGLGLDKEQATAVIETQLSQEWMDKEATLSIDLETTVDGKENVLAISGISIDSTGNITSGDMHFNKLEFVSTKEIRTILDYIEAHIMAGGKVVTHNGNDFDWRILGSKAGRHAQAQRIAELSIDLQQNLAWAKSTFDNTVQSLPYTLSNTDIALGGKGKSDEGWRMALYWKKAQSADSEVSLSDISKILKDNKAYEKDQVMDYYAEEIKKINEMSDTEAALKFEEYTRDDSALNISVHSRLLAKRGSTISDIASWKGNGSIAIETVRPTWNLPVKNHVNHERHIQNRGLTKLQLATGVRENGIINKATEAPAGDSTIREVLEGIVENITPDMTDTNTQVAVIVGLLMRKKDLTFPMIRPFFPLLKDMDLVTQENFSRNLNDAYTLAQNYMRKINQVMNAPHGEFFNRYYWEARLFIDTINEEQMLPETDIFNQFISWVSERDAGMDFSDQEIVAAEAALTSVVQEFGYDRDPDTLTEAQAEARVFKSHNNFITEFPELAEVSLDIQEAVNKGWMSKTHAKMYRWAIYKAWKWNPETMQNLDIQFVKGHIDPFAQKQEGGRYLIRIGNQQLDPTKDNIGAAYTLAHEFAHIGRLKFLKNNGEEYRSWRRLFLSSKGKSMAKKVITAMHGGNWNEAAQTEYKKVMDDKSGEEFIATLTGYFMIHDSATLINDLSKSDNRMDAEEAEVYQKAEGIVGKIMSFVGTILDRISSVFTTFKQSEKKEYESFVKLVHKTMGFNKEGAPRLSDVGNPPTKPLYLTSETDKPPTEIATQESRLEEEVSTLDNVLERIDEIENLPPDELEDAALTEELEKLKKEEIALNKGIVELGGNELDPLSLSRSEYISGMKKLEELFSKGTEADGTTILDVAGILDRGTAFQKRVLLSYVMRQASLMMHGQDGKFMGLAASTIKTMPYFNKPNGLWSKLKKAMGVMATGSSETSATWNSPFVLLVMLSTMVDNSMSTFAGHWGNIDGIPDVMASVGQINSISVEIENNIERLDKIIIGPLESHLRLNHLFGTVEESTFVRDEVAKEIYRKIENPEHVYTNDAIKDNPDIKEIVENVVIHYTQLKSIIEEQAMKVGIQSHPFNHSIPYRFATGRVVTGEATALAEFDSEMQLATHAELIEQLNKPLDQRRMCPFTLYSMKMLPHLQDVDEGMLELAEIKRNNPKLWEEIMILAAIRKNTTEKKFMGLTKEDAEAEREAAKLTMNNILHEGMETTTKRANYDSYVIPAVQSLMKYMAYPNNRYNAKFLGFKDSGGFFGRYKRAAMKNNSARLNIFAANTRENPLVTMGLIEGSDITKVTGGTPRITNPMSVYVSNIRTGAGAGVYFPNHWAVPSVMKVMDNPSIAPYLVWNPAQISSGIMRHLGHQVAEVSMYRDKYGIHTDTGTLLELAGQALNSSDLLNSDGTVISHEDRQMLVKATGVIRRKYNTILGKTGKPDADRSDEVLGFLSKYAPDITRIVFGTNLTLATFVVENTMNIIDNALGRGNLGDAYTALIAPLLKLDSNIAQAVARDQAEIIRVFSQGHIPDYARPDARTREKFIQRLPQWLGERNMHLASLIHEMICTSRAVIFRGWIKDAVKSGNLDAFLKLHKKHKPRTREQYAKLMKRANLPGTDGQMMMYLMNDGVLTENTVPRLKAMLKGTDYYSLGDMIKEAGTMYDAKLKDEESGELQHDLHMRDLKIIQGLRRAEQKFIHEILVEPNPFDTNTGNTSWDHFFETFRRYPVLFSGQQIGRRHPRFSLRRNATHLISYGIVDSMYMTLLMVAAGYPIDDLIEEWKKNPGKQAASLLIRMPHLGRYAGLLTEILFGLFEQSQRQPAGFIPVGAFTSFARNPIKVIKSLIDEDKDFDWRAMIMMIRIFPIIGDAITRAITFQVLGEDYQKQSSSQRKKSTSSNKFATYGSIYNESNIAQYSGTVNEIFKELGWKGATFESLPLELQESISNRMAEITPMERQPVEAPPEPVEAPVSRPIKKDVVGAIKEQKPLEAPSGLLE